DREGERELAARAPARPGGYDDQREERARDRGDPRRKGALAELADRQQQMLGGEHDPRRSQQEVLQPVREEDADDEEREIDERLQRDRKDRKDRARPVDGIRQPTARD